MNKRGQRVPAQPSQGAGLWPLTGATKQYHALWAWSFIFEVLPSTNHGFLRVSAKDRRYWEFGDGTPFFAIGQNVAFIKDVRQQSEMIRQLGAHGGNFCRVWACAEDWGLAIEARKSAWGRSWDWSPPFAASPDREGYHEERLCLKINGESGASITMNPCYPVPLKPGVAYQLKGAARAAGEAGLSFDLNGSRTVAPKRQWTPFAEEFTAAANQRVLPNLVFQLTGKGTMWIKDLSLTEKNGGAELLWEADPNRPPLGVYNLRDADMLDRLVSAAEESGVYLQIVLLTRDHYLGRLKGRSGRDYEEALDYARRLARYFVARWGYSTHVAAWEYFNEMDPGLPTERFYTELAKFLDEVDANRHLRVNSTWHSPSKDYRHPHLDTANLHYYLRPPDGELWKDEVASILNRWEANRRALDRRPLFFAEFGITDANWQRAPQLGEDQDFVHLHNASWLALALGFGSTPCHWFWDDIHRRQIYPLYQPLARFVAGIPLNAGNLSAAAAEADKGLRVFGQQTEAFAFLWIWNPEATWWKIAMDKKEPVAVAGARLSVTGLKPGDYRAQWWDTRSGQIMREQPLRVSGPSTILPIPDFTRDLAGKILR